MKKLMIFVAIATVVFTSCESKSGKIVKDPFKTSLKDFKEVIEKSRLDSSFVNKQQNVVYYQFYLPEYKIDITATDVVPFESTGEILIFTKDITGNYVKKFCNAPNNWTEKQKQEILQLLLSKKEDKKGAKKKNEMLLL